MRHENKVNKNKVSLYCKALRCEQIENNKGVVPFMSNLQTGILLIGTLVTNFSELLIEIHIFPSNKTHLKASSAKCRPFCLGLNVLNDIFNSLDFIPGKHFSNCISQWCSLCKFGIFVFSINAIAILFAKLITITYCQYLSNFNSYLHTMRMHRWK